jgi:hypothetical protein
VNPFSMPAKSFLFRKVEVVVKLGRGGRGETGNKHQQRSLAGYQDEMSGF